jgi:hypothetical protein
MRLAPRSTKSQPSAILHFTSTRGDFTPGISAKHEGEMISTERLHELSVEAISRVHEVTAVPIVEVTASTEGSVSAMARRERTELSSLPTAWRVDDR